MKEPKFNIGDVVFYRKEIYPPMRLEKYTLNIISKIERIIWKDWWWYEYQCGNCDAIPEEDLELYQKSSQSLPSESNSTPLSNQEKQDFWKRFANIIKEWSKYWDIENLLWWTLGTIGKRYDDEEQYDTIKDDTQEWLDWVADYMND